MNDGGGHLLLSIPEVSATQIDRASNDSFVLVESATLSLCLVDIPSTVLKSVPSRSEPPAYSNPSASGSQTVSVDTWLVLSFEDGLIEIPLSFDTQPTFEPPNAYLIPILPSDVSATESPPEKSSLNAMIKIEFLQSIDEDTLDIFDNILAGYTAYRGRHQISFTSVPPGSSGKLANEARLAIVDEKTGEICGELDSGIVIDGPLSGPHSPPYPAQSLAGPVMVSIMPPKNGHPNSLAQITPINPESKSKILSGADWISKGILTGSDLISNLIAQGGQTYRARTKPTETQTVLSSSTQKNADRLLGYTQSAAQLSGKAAKMVGNMAGRVGDSIGKTTGIQRDSNGRPPTGARGYVHKGLTAVNTVFDSLETGGKKVLYTAGNTTANVVTHSYGSQVGGVAEKVGQSVQNVALVYIDARGVSRKAILKSVGKAIVRGKMTDGREVIFGSDEAMQPFNQKSPGPSLPPVHGDNIKPALPPRDKDETRPL